MRFKSILYLFVTVCVVIVLVFSFISIQDAINKTMDKLGYSTETTDKEEPTVTTYDDLVGDPEEETFNPPGLDPTWLLVGDEDSVLWDLEIKYVSTSEFVGYCPVVVIQSDLSSGYNYSVIFKNNIEGSYMGSFPFTEFACTIYDFENDAFDKFAYCSFNQGYATFEYKQLGTKYTGFTFGPLRMTGGGIVESLTTTEINTLEMYYKSLVDFNIYSTEIVNG